MIFPEIPILLPLNTISIIFSNLLFFALPQHKHTCIHSEKTMYAFEINHEARGRRYIQRISASSNSNVARNAFERTSEFASFPENS